VLNGLNYLHSEGVVHSDIKAGNVLSDGEGNIKLSDFGCSKSTLNRLYKHNEHSERKEEDLTKSTVHTSVKGSIYWMSPEMLLDKAYGRKHDVWSLGCLVIEMATAQHPWPEVNTLAELMVQLKHKKSPPIPPHLSN
jgi:mitogen-activated protein kinase kinase kinase 2